MYSVTFIYFYASSCVSRIVWFSRLKDYVWQECMSRCISKQRHLEFIKREGRFRHSKLFWLSSLARLCLPKVTTGTWINWFLRGESARPDVSDIELTNDSRQVANCNPPNIDLDDSCTKAASVVEKKEVSAAVYSLDGGNGISRENREEIMSTAL